MKKLSKVLAIVFAVTLVASGCAKKSAPQVSSGKVPGTAKDGNELNIEKASMNLIKAVNAGKYELVSTEDLKKWIDAKESMVIVDTMPAKSYDKHRIPTAVNAELPVKMEEVTKEQKDAYLKALGTDKEKKVVVYCGFVGCERSHVGAVIAKENGFKKVFRQPGGIVGWEDAGYEAEKAK